MCLFGFQMFSLKPSPVFHFCSLISFLEQKFLTLMPHSFVLFLWLRILWFLNHKVIFVYMLLIHLLFDIYNWETNQVRFYVCTWYEIVVNLFQYCFFSSSFPSTIYWIIYSLLCCSLEHLSRPIYTCLFLSFLLFVAEPILLLFVDFEWCQISDGVNFFFLQFSKLI